MDHSSKKESRKVFWTAFKLGLPLIILPLVLVGKWGIYGLLVTAGGVAISLALAAILYFETGSYGDFFTFLRDKWYIVPVSGAIGCAALFPLKYLM